VSADQRVAARRERLLDAAVARFAARGFAATGVKDVCSEAGLTDRYFYESFEDSTALLVAVVDHITAHLFEVVAAAVLEAAPDPQAQAQAAIGSYVRALADDPAAARVLFVEAPAGGAEVERQMRATLRRFADLVASTASAHVADIPAAVMRLGALSLVGAIERVMIEWQEGELDLSIDEIVESLVGMLLMAAAAAGIEPGRAAKTRTRTA
jgi:AcrR family transcriptional regulator